MRNVNVGRPENQRRDLALVATLLIASWALSSLESSHTLGLTRALRGSILAPFLAADATYEQRTALYRRAAALEEERDRLYSDLASATELERENRQLRELLALPDREIGSFVVAELVPGRPMAGDSHTFLLRGAGLASIDVPTGVSVPDGLVGVLRSRSGSTGLGEFWTHPDFRVSVRSTVGGATGIVRATVSPDGATLMLVEGVPFQARIPPGTLLETAGLGGVFPPGIQVGRVLAEEESRSGWSHSYLVEPAVRPGSVGAVTAWSYDADAERRERDPLPGETDAPGEEPTGAPAEDGPGDGG